jgi:hypothetical protein
MIQSFINAFGRRLTSTILELIFGFFNGVYSFIGIKPGNVDVPGFECFLSLGFYITNIGSGIIASLFVIKGRKDAKGENAQKEEAYLHSVWY